MGNNCTDNSCETEKGSCNDSQNKDDDCCTIAEDLSCLAKQAKHELLKEKMKKALEAKIGTKLDKIAAVAVDATVACIQHEMAAKEACNNYKEKLLAAFKG